MKKAKRTSKPTKRSTSVKKNKSNLYHSILSFLHGKPALIALAVLAVSTPLLFLIKSFFVAFLVSYFLITYH